jgi:hypothetical protein
MVAHSAAAQINGIPGFMTATPMPEYNDFARTADTGVSSNFVEGPWDSHATNFGFESMQMSFEPTRMDFDNVAMDPALMMPMHVDGGMGSSQNGPFGTEPRMSPQNGHFGTGPGMSPQNGHFGTGPGMSPSFDYRPVQAPLRTPPDPRDGSPAIFYPPLGNYSGTDTGAAEADLAAIFAAQDAWTGFQ